MTITKEDIRAMEEYARIKQAFHDVPANEVRHMTSFFGYQPTSFDFDQAMADYAGGARLVEFDQAPADRVRQAAFDAGDYIAVGAYVTPSSSLMAGFIRIEDRQNLEHLWNPEVAYAWFNEDGSFYAGHVSGYLRKFVGTSALHVRPFETGRTPAQGLAQFIALFKKAIANRDKWYASELERVNANYAARGRDTFLRYGDWTLPDHRRVVAA